MEEQQGTVIDCVYCTRVHPDLATECPRCHGSRSFFRPARMMDGPTARGELLEALYRAGNMRRDAADAATADGQEGAYVQTLIRLLEEAVIHGFDLAEALAEEIRRAEGEIGS